MEKQIEKKNEEIENLKVSVDVENIYAEECDAMRNKMVSLDIDRALLKSENGKLTRQIKEKSHLIHQKKQQIGKARKISIKFSFGSFDAYAF